MYPILITAWKRPYHLRDLINAIRPLKPNKIFFSCDGPKKNNLEEYNLVELTKKQLEFIDWECNLKTLFSEHNQGCCNSMTRALNWFFDNVDAGIILEDDCIPHEDFLPFCNELLDKYKFDNRVWSISGTNFQDNQLRGDGSYYFSKYIQVWGWATWKRSWKEYDIEMKSWNKLKASDLVNSIFDSKKEFKHWYKLWNTLLLKNKPDAWDYRFSYSSIINRGYSIIPNRNLVRNIGFDKSATNTKINRFKTEISEGLLPISHPSFIIDHKDADKYTFITRFSSISLEKIITITRRRPLHYLRAIIRLIFR